MKFTCLFIIFHAFLINQFLTHKCIHDSLNVTLQKMPQPTSRLPFGDKQMAQEVYENIRIYADFSCIIYLKTHKF